jgi:hypothetical protein
MRLFFKTGMIEMCCGISAACILMMGCGENSKTGVEEESDDLGGDGDTDTDADTQTATDKESDDGGVNGETDIDWMSLCLYWKSKSCEVFKGCGMLQAWPDCNFEESCASFEEPCAGCDSDLAMRDLDDCLKNMKEMCESEESTLTFETIRDVPGCYSVDLCLGWPV